MVSDAGDALYLTPYIESGEVEKGRELAEAARSLVVQQLVIACYSHGAVSQPNY